MFALSEGQLYYIEADNFSIEYFACLQQNTGGRTVGNVLVHVHERAEK